MSSGGNVRRCQGIKATGGRCEKGIGPSQTYCYHHDPNEAGRRKENAAKAARAKHAEPCDEILSIRSEMRELAQSVRERKVTPGVGSVVNQILGNVLKTFDQERRQREFDEVRSEMAELRELFENQRSTHYG